MIELVKDQSTNKTVKNWSITCAELVDHLFDQQLTWPRKTITDKIQSRKLSKLIIHFNNLSLYFVQVEELNKQLYIIFLTTN